MLAPSAANARACARPCPRAPPVISATRPSSTFIPSAVRSKVSEHGLDRCEYLCIGAVEARSQPLHTSVYALEKSSVGVAGGLGVAGGGLGLRDRKSVV